MLVKRIARRTVLRLLVVLLCLIAAARADAQLQLLDRVLARVGAEVITLTDVQAAAGLGVVEAVSDEEALQRVIDRHLALTEVERLSRSSPDPAAVEAEVARMRAHAGDRLASVLETTGTSESRLVELARETIRIRTYLDGRFPSVPVSDADAEQYYQAHPEAFTRDGVRLTFQEALPMARGAVAAQRRNARIAQWLANLRVRLEVAYPRAL